MPIMSRDCYYISTDKPMLGRLGEKTNFGKN